MSSINSPAHYLQPSADVKQQLGHAIARYGLFHFLDSHRSASDLMPYVQSSLPSGLNCSVGRVRSKLSKKSRRKWSKRLLSSALSGGLSLLYPIVNLVGDAVDSFGSTLLDGLNQGTYTGGDSIIQDEAWGTTTVRTDSLKGDLAWSTLVSIGAATQPLRINIDSGSADLFLFDPSCEHCSFTNHSAYDHFSSTSFETLPNITFSSDYADGSSIDGYLAKDLVSFGGTLEVEQQLFGMATNASAHWAMLAVDGLMGIGPDSLSTFNVSDNQGVFSRLVADKKLLSPVIGIALVKEADNYFSHGEFSFGEIDSKWIKGCSKENLAWRNVTSRNFWGIDLSGIYVDGTNAMSSDDPPRAIIDTGTSLTLVSEGVAAKIHAKISGAQMDPANGVWLVPCSIRHVESKPDIFRLGDPPSSPTNWLPWGSTLSKTFPSVQTLPTDTVTSSSRTPSEPSFISSPNVFFEFGAGQERFGIPASDLAYQVASDDDADFKPQNETMKMCYSGIQSGGDSFVVLGDTFIKNHYIALKYEANGKKTIGIGNRTDVDAMT